MQQRFHVQKERKLPLLSDKRGREREGRVGLQGALCSSPSFLLCPRCGCSLRYFRLVPALYL